MALRALCLCDGYGGFELGLKLESGNGLVPQCAAATFTQLSERLQR